MGFPHNVEYECTQKCKLLEHGQQITLALTKRAIPADKLAAFIGKYCKNFADIKDAMGRSALHLASSVDRCAIVEWLLNYGALINAKDNESGSTALHRAIFYGCIDSAVVLMKYGASLDILDDDCRSPLQYTCKFGNYHHIRNSNNELLVWGTNKNYNLGLGDDEGCPTPQFIECFRKNQSSIEHLAIGPLHSFFLDKKNTLYSVGLGKGGKLGNGSEKNTAIPTKIKVPIKNLDEKIAQISISKFHSLLITTKGSVYACGSNEYKQLGMKPPPTHLTSFKELPYFHQTGIDNIIGVMANDYYSIAFTHSELFVWGTNTGQFGLNNPSSELLLPKQISIPDNSKIQFIESSNYAIAVSTTSKNIVLFYNHKMKFIKQPLLASIKSISLIADEDPQKMTKGSKPAKLKILILTESNVIYIWYEDMQQYMRCSLGIIRLTEMDKVIYRKNQVLLLSDGDVYSGRCVKVAVPRNELPSSQASNDKWLCGMKQDINEEQQIRIDLERIPSIDRAVNIYCVYDFDSFAVLQESSRKYYELPKLMAEEYTFKNLLNDSEFDNIHDVIFHVDNVTFCAHKFIIYSRAKGLKVIVEKADDKNVYLDLKNLSSKMFELILKHIYINYTLSLDDIDDIEESLPENVEISRSVICKMVMEFGEKFHLNELVNNMKCLLENNMNDRQKSRFNRLKRTAFPELYDITIKCANNQEIQAHKCILISRLEYFNLMLTNEWSETKIISLTTIPIEYMEPVIDFLYTSDVDGFRKQNYSESYLYNLLVICDQFFINRLRKVCEILVLEKISIRKSAEMLEFGCSYNCAILKRGCLDFICQNLERVLLQRCLENCETDVLHLINTRYREMFKNVFDFRMITPDAYAISDEKLLKFVDNFSVDLEFRMTDNLIPDKYRVRPKFKETKAQLTKRNYEKEAISVLKESVSKDPGHSSASTSYGNKDEFLKEASEINEKFLNQSSSWMKVSDKKDTKKKEIGIVTSALKVNNILQQENKPKESLINLNGGLKSPEDNSIRSVFSIGDITPLKGGKVSQKQRKRLSSESVKTEYPLVTSPIAIPTTSQYPNSVWGEISSPVADQSSLADILKTTGSRTKTKSISSSNQMTPPNSNKSNNGSTSKGATPKTSETSVFSKIVAEEKQQKDYFAKLRNKSLVLTQIEETAIAELKEFYNVDNCEDEIITIERLSMPAQTNFPVWQRN